MNGPASPGDLQRACQRWNLVADGEPFTSRNARLLPVRMGDEPAMLKIAHEEEERHGAELMAWWSGHGAARVLVLDGPVLVMERATGPGDLAAMARDGDDDRASRLLCAAAAALHRPRPMPPSATVIPLVHRFRALWPAADAQGGLFREAATAARRLLDEPEDPAVLHGDLHHGNVLDFGARGWLAIDPKGLVGERGFDFANILCNPDSPVATRPGRFERQLGIIGAAARLEPRRLAAWVLAWAGLSAAWALLDGEDVAPALLVAGLARRHLQP